MISVLLVLPPSEQCYWGWLKFSEFGLPVQLFPEYPVIFVPRSEARTVFKIHDYEGIVANRDRFPKFSGTLRLRFF